MSFQKLTYMTLALALLASPAAFADSAASAPAGQSSSSNVLETLKKKVKLSYTAEILGATTKSLSGNSAGGGTNLIWNHYVGTGYRITKPLSINITQPFRQNIDEKPASVADPLVVNDPYLTLTHASLAGSEKYGTSLSGYVRYYMPLSRSTNRNAKVDDNARVAAAGAPNDQGRGAVRVLLTPSKTFMDGALTLAGTTLVQYRIAKRSSAERAALVGDPMRNDYYFLFNPSVAYQVSSKVEAYVEYATGALTHNTGDGNWTKMNDPDYGQYVSPGVNWQASKRLLVNPYFSMGPVFRGLKNVDIGLIAAYTFL